VPVSRAPCSGVEQVVADRVEAVMPAEGITPGERVCHDAQKGRLDVDWVYPDALPRPLALEVTAIVASEDEAGSRESESLSERLTEVAEAENLGSWLVAVQINRDFRLLQPVILDIIREKQSEREQMLADGTSIRPGSYTNDLAKLPTDRWGAYIAEQERLRELGLNSVTPIASKRENYIGVMPGRGDIVRGFDEELRERIDAKAKVLGKVGDFQRHLAVIVLRWDVSGDPESMAVPELPPTIDILWVVHRSTYGGDRPEVWVARRSSSSWSVHVQE
jgi:hypothetical protein